MTSTELDSKQGHRNAEARRNRLSLRVCLPLWLCSFAVER